MSTHGPKKRRDENGELPPVPKILRIAGKDSRHLEQLLVNQLERIHALLELNVLIGQLGLVLDLTQLLLDQLLGALRKRREARAVNTSKGLVSHVSAVPIVIQHGKPRGVAPPAWRGNSG